MNFNANDFLSTLSTSHHQRHLDYRRAAYRVKANLESASAIINKLLEPYAIIPEFTDRPTPHISFDVDQYERKNPDLSIVIYITNFDLASIRTYIAYLAQAGLLGRHETSGSTQHFYYTFPNIRARITFAERADCVKVTHQKVYESVEYICPFEKEDN